jgi:hypothetical protein
MVASLRHAITKLCDQGPMPRIQRALRGFRKLRPLRSRIPCPYGVMAAIVAHLVFLGKRPAALLVLTSFAAYLRPGEARRWLIKDLVRPIASARHRAARGAPHAFFGLMVAPAEDLLPSKTQTFDDTVVLDRPAFLGPMLAGLAGRRSRDAVMFDVSAADMVRLWLEATALLGLPPMCLYQLRHGGASYDTAMRFRNFDEVMQRGRWLALSSVRRYAKSGQVQKLLEKLSPLHLQFTEWAANNLERILSGKVAARCIPLTT